MNVFAQKKKDSSIIPPPNINSKFTSKNFDDRQIFLILHYTSGGMASSFETLLGNGFREVSSHFLINDAPDILFKDYIYSLVPEDKRAWHAGISIWGQNAGLNSASIGVEIVNRNGNEDEYPEEQIQQVIALSKYLVARYNIQPIRVLGHSDIAPSRKEDPGSLFPWKQLYDNGIGAWYDSATLMQLKASVTSIPDIKTYQQKLKDYGYGVNVTGVMDGTTVDVIAAFQRHFRPQFISGQMDVETYIILLALIEKYLIVGFLGNH